jgi:hypothetical protein
MITMWIMAVLQCYIIFEPIIIVWAALTPFCIGNETRVGRCCGRMRWFFIGELCCSLMLHMRPCLRGPDGC